MKLISSVILPACFVALISCSESQQPAVAKSCSNCASAEVPSVDYGEEAFIRKQLQWIVDNSPGMMLPKTLPKVVYLSKKEMGRAALDSKKQRVGEYIRQTKTIYLLKSRKLTSKGKGTLIHELVHYVQDVNGNLGGPCSRAQEDSAYELSKKWLRKEGVPEHRLPKRQTKYLNKLPC